MLNDFWVFFSGLIIFIGLVASEGLLLVVGSLVLVLAIAARIWERFAFRSVSHTRSISRKRAFVGDTIEYSVSLDNDKVLPLIWVDIQDSFPEGLDLIGATMRGTGLESNRQHTITTSLLPYQKATWTYSLTCSERGYHRIGPVRLRTGDIFGFSSAETRYNQFDHILVFPRVVDIEGLVFPPEHPMGDIRGTKPVYFDTNRVVGQRDYQPRDPMKHIDWKATARVRKLQTKVFEPVVSLNMLIVMNGSTREHSWQGSNRRLFERTVTVAASVASLAQRRGFTYGLVSNAVASYSGKWIHVPMGASSSQLNMALEALAMAAPYVVAPLAEVVNSEKNSLPAGTTVILVTSSLSDSLLEDIAGIQDHGCRVLVLYSGDGLPDRELGDINVIPMYSVLDDLEAHEPAVA
ncbi:DUF58 domain-containing protein [candidate division KSB1 bacterium]|nr:DUF58 domain-containing protein [candidate division KSB1 bacterium]